MKYIVLAVIFSILIHLGIFYKFQNVSLKQEIQRKNTATQTSSILYAKLSKKIKKDTVLKKQIKKKQGPSIAPAKPKKIYKKVKKEIKKEIKRPQVRKKPPIKRKKQNSKTINSKKEKNYEDFNTAKIQKKTLENYLHKPQDNLKDLKSMLKSYKKNHPELRLKNDIDLYGKEFQEFTSIQKAYIKNNLNLIGRITQYHLRYPRISVRTKQEGFNIITFFLYPNGDISNPVFIKTSGFSPLDKQSYETIQIAYKDYPRPKEKTKIIIRVYYKLY